MSAQLRRAMVEAEACGVTRLADVTDLDRLGVPVFQAVRPWGLSLSVHQGKGLTSESAQMWTGAQGRARADPGVSRQRRD